MNLKTTTTRQKLTIGVTSFVAVGALTIGGLYAAAAINGQPDEKKTPPAAAEVESSSTPEPAPVTSVGDDVEDVPAATPVDNGDEPVSSDGVKTPAQPAPQTPVKPAPAPAPKPAPAPVPAPPPPAPPQIPAKVQVSNAYGTYVPYSPLDCAWFHTHTVGWGGTSLDSNHPLFTGLQWSYTVDGPTVTYYSCL